MDRRFDHKYLVLRLLYNTFHDSGTKFTKNNFKLETGTGLSLLVKTKERWCVQQMLRRTTENKSGKSVAFADALEGNRARRGGAPFATKAVDADGRGAHAPFIRWRNMGSAFLHTVMDEGGNCC